MSAGETLAEEVLDVMLDVPEGPRERLSWAVGTFFRESGAEAGFRVVGWRGPNPAMRAARRMARLRRSA